MAPHKTSSLRMHQIDWTPSPVEKRHNGPTPIPISHRSLCAPPNHSGSLVLNDTKAVDERSITRTAGHRVFVPNHHDISLATRRGPSGRAIACVFLRWQAGLGQPGKRVGGDDPPPLERQLHKNARRVTRTTSSRRLR